jgi:hypothetical protein
MTRAICLLLLLAFLFLDFATVSSATYVKGYFRKDGTYVNPYYRNDFGSSYSTPKYKTYDYGSFSPKSFSSPSNNYDDDMISVKGYYRSDGTYVRPHYRSAPDDNLWNNFGSPSTKQENEWKSLDALPSYKNDYDNDGIPNRYDRDDDNDLIPDDQDKNPYGKSKSIFDD